MVDACRQSTTNNLYLAMLTSSISLGSFNTNMLAKLMLGGALFALAGLFAGSSFFIATGSLVCMGAITVLFLSVFFD